MRWVRHVLAAATLPVAGFILFGSTGRDDAHITFWAAHALSSLGSIVNVNGERLEQSSSLLFTVLIAAIERLTRAPTAAIAAVLSVAFGVGTVILAGRLASRVRAGAGATAMMLAALSPPLVYWSWSGMETSLHALLVLAFALGTLDLLDGRQGFRARALLLVQALLLLLVRPEAAFTAALSLSVIGLVLLPRKHTRLLLGRVGGLGVGLALLAGGLMSFRKAYFGTVFPQTVIAKVHPFDAQTIREGIMYLVRQIEVPIVCVVAFLAMVQIGRRVEQAWRARGLEHDGSNLARLLCFAFLASHVAFAIAVGGDWMELGRFLVAPLPFAIALAVDEISIRALQGVPVLALTLLAAGSLVTTAVASGPEGPSTGVPIWRRTEVATPGDASWFEAANLAHADDLSVVPEVSRLVEAAILRGRGRAVVWSGQAGFVAYYLGKRFYGAFTFVDTRGLATRQVTDCVSPAALRRTSSGVILTYEDYLRRRESLSETCALPAPDVIFDFIDPAQARALTAHGYVKVYVSRGNRARAPESVFARRELVDQT